MNRRLFLLSASAAAAPAPRRPNILLILPDQLRACALGVMGDPNVQSPNIDRLASQGILMRNTIANTPVCCPARANILTGLYAHRNGMVANDLRLRESQPTLSSTLRNAGYRNGFVGKWHLDGGPRMPGFVPPGPRRHGFESWAANECSHAHFNTQYFRDSPEPLPVKGFEADGWTDLAVEFLRSHSGDHRPFFLTVQMGPPHDPYKAPPEYSRLYDPATLELRPNFKPGGATPENIAEYYAMISAVDAQVGRLIGELDALGYGQDTIVLFTSDHGDMLGSQGARLKRKPWEESIHVPGIVRFPRSIKPASVSDALFSHVDFAPTLLGLCGVPVPASMQGSNLTTALTTGAPGPSEAYLQIFGPYRGDGVEAGWRGLRSHRYTYARYEDEPWLLYDNLNDPFQQENLAGDEKLVAQMDQRLASWMRRTGDSWLNNWSEPVEDNSRLYRDRAYYSVDEYLRAQGQDSVSRMIDLSDPTARGDRQAVIFYATGGLPSHAFVSLEREDSRGFRTRVEAYGFYPHPDVSTARAATRAVRGVILDDLLATHALPRAVDRLVVYVTPALYQTVEHVIERWKCDGSYHLLDKDCVTFAGEVARTLGLRTPPRTLRNSRPAAYMRDLIALN